MEASGWKGLTSCQAGLLLLTTGASDVGTLLSLLCCVLFLKFFHCFLFFFIDFCFVFCCLFVSMIIFYY